ncbi:MAG TPA: V-type ATPase 116kDa subunit family protein [Planctomycetota bacterium]|nr:V-type ATPase 116kDa subunit family protein [Planctomycetota bacterium]
MLRSVPMSKVLLVGPKEGLEALTDLLHNLNRAHIVKAKKAPEGFEHGRPLASGTQASENLVQLRALKATLPVQPMYDGPLLKTSEVTTLIEGTLKDAATKLMRKMQEREELQRKVDVVNETLRTLTPFLALKLNLDLYRPFQNLTVLVGSAQKDPEAELTASGIPFELFRGDAQAPQALALFVETKHAAKAQEILVRAMFREERIPLPTPGLTDYALDKNGQFSGSVETLAHELHNKAATLNASLQAVDRDTEKLRAEWSHSCLPAEEHLQIAVEKSELPFDVLVTGHAYMVEFWLPDTEVADVKSQLEKSMGDSFHFEVVQQGMGDHGHGHAEAHGAGDAHGEAHGEHAGHDAHGSHGEEAHHEVKEQVPVKLNNPPYFSFFEMLTRMFSTPKYDEIDPTMFLAIFFPIYFGLMVGDLGYGVLIAGLGLLAMKAGKAGSDLRSIGMFLFSGGLVAVVTGYLVFGDLFGISLHGQEGEWGWDTVLGIKEFPFIGHHPLIHKLASEGVNEFLVLSLVFGMVHMGLGFILGSINEVKHSAKHGVAKMAWFGVLWSLGLVIMNLQMCRDTGVGQAFWKVLAKIGMEETPGVMSIKMWGGLGIASVIALVITEPAGLVELLGPLSNTISYTRLAGIAVAKAALAAAMNTMILPLWEAGVAGKIGCIGLLIVAHALILGLGILSGAVQAMRLNFFEFFSKFMAGGGTDYAPFGRTRQYTVAE